MLIPDGIIALLNVFEFFKTFPGRESSILSLKVVSNRVRHSSSQFCCTSSVSFSAEIKHVIVGLLSEAGTIFLSFSKNASGEIMSAVSKSSLCSGSAKIDLPISSVIETVSAFGSDMSDAKNE